MAASLAPGVADLLQGHLCGLGCMHEAPPDEVTQVGWWLLPGGLAWFKEGWLISRCTACEPGSAARPRTHQEASQPPLPPSQRLAAICHAWLSCPSSRPHPSPPHPTPPHSPQPASCRRSMRRRCGRHTSCCRARSPPSTRLWRRCSRRRQTCWNSRQGCWNRWQGTVGCSRLQSAGAAAEERALGSAACAAGAGAAGAGSAAAGACAAGAGVAREEAEADPREQQPAARHWHWCLVGYKPAEE